jgi:hypothetical protein
MIRGPGGLDQPLGSFGLTPTYEWKNFNIKNPKLSLFGLLENRHFDSE